MLLTVVQTEARKLMLESLVHFVPTLGNASIAERLELFRSTLSSFEPVEKVKDGEEAKGLGEMLDSSVGLDTVILPELHITNSRAGLYIYLNACVSQRPHASSSDDTRQGLAANPRVCVCISLSEGRCWTTTLFSHTSTTAIREISKLRP